MALIQYRTRRLIFAAGFAATIALSPVVGAVALPGPTGGLPTASCPDGESEDPYTFACVPELAPGTDSGAPSEQELTECSGRDQANCVEQEEYAPPAVQMPDTTVNQSP